jgi:hypothetical protein
MVVQPSSIAVPEPEAALTTRPVWDWDASELDELEWWRPGVLWSDDPQSSRPTERGLLDRPRLCERQVHPPAAEMRLMAEQQAAGLKLVSSSESLLFRNCEPPE